MSCWPVLRRLRLAVGWSRSWLGRCLRPCRWCWRWFAHGWVSFRSWVSGVGKWTRTPRALGDSMRMASSLGSMAASGVQRHPDELAVVGMAEQGSFGPVEAHVPEAEPHRPLQVGAVDVDAGRLARTCRVRQHDLGGLGLVRRLGPNGDVAVDIERHRGVLLIVAGQLRQGVGQEPCIVVRDNWQRAVAFAGSGTCRATSGKRPSVLIRR